MPLIVIQVNPLCVRGFTLRQGGSPIPEAGVLRAAHFLVIKVIHDDRMPRLCPAVGEFVVHKGTIIFSRKALCPLLQLPEIAPVSSGIDGVVQRLEVRVFLLNIGQDVFFEAAPQIQIFQPHQVALVFHPVEDGLEIRDTGKNRSDKAHGADACIIDLLHGVQPPLDADGIVHVIFETLIQRVNRPGNSDFSHLFQQVDVPHHQVGFGTDQNLRAAAFQLLQQPAGIAELLLLRQVSVCHRADDYTLPGILPGIFNNEV